MPYRRTAAHKLALAFTAIQSIEPASAALRRPVVQNASRLEARREPAMIHFELTHNVREPDRIHVAEGPAAERRKADAEHGADIAMSAPCSASAFRRS